MCLANTCKVYTFYNVPVSTVISLYISAVQSPKEKYFVYVIPVKEDHAGLRCSRSYDQTYFDQQDYPYNADPNAGWINIEEGFRGWQPTGRQMGDSSCDSIFNVETCLYDMGDCCLPGRYTIERYNLETSQTWTLKYITIHFINL